MFVMIWILRNNKRESFKEHLTTAQRAIGKAMQCVEEMEEEYEGERYEDFSGDRYMGRRTHYRRDNEDFDERRGRY